MIGVDLRISSVHLAEAPASEPEEEEGNLGAALRPIDPGVYITAHFDLIGVASASRQFRASSLPMAIVDDDNESSLDSLKVYESRSSKVGIFLLLQPQGLKKTRDWSSKSLDMALSLTLHNMYCRPVLLRGSAQLRLELELDGWSSLPEASSILCRRSWTSKSRVHMMHAEGVCTLGAVVTISMSIRELDVKPRVIPLKSGSIGDIAATTSSVQLLPAAPSRPVALAEWGDIGYGGLDEIKKLALERRNPFLGDKEIDANYSFEFDSKGEEEENNLSEDEMSSLESFASILNKYGGVQNGIKATDTEEQQSNKVALKSDPSISSVKCKIPKSIDITEEGSFVKYFIERDVSNGLERPVKYDPSLQGGLRGRVDSQSGQARGARRQRGRKREDPPVNKMKPASSVASRKPPKRVSEVSHMLMFSPLKRREDALKQVRKASGKKKPIGGETTQEPSTTATELVSPVSSSRRSPRLPGEGELTAGSPPLERAPRRSRVARSVDALEGPLASKAGELSAPEWWPLSDRERDTSGIILQL